MIGRIGPIDAGHVALDSLLGEDEDLGDNTGPISRRSGAAARDIRVGNLMTVDPILVDAEAPASGTSSARGPMVVKTSMAPTRC